MLCWALCFIAGCEESWSNHADDAGVDDTVETETGAHFGVDCNEGRSATMM